MGGGEFMCPEKSRRHMSIDTWAKEGKRKTVFRREIKRQKAGGKQHHEIQAEHMIKHLLLRMILSWHPSVSAEGFYTLQPSHGAKWLQRRKLNVLTSGSSWRDTGAGRVDEWLHLHHFLLLLAYALVGSHSTQFLTIPLYLTISGREVRMRAIVNGCINVPCWCNIPSYSVLSVIQ